MTDQPAVETPPEEVPSWGYYLPSQLDPVARILAEANGAPDEHRRWHAAAANVVPALPALAEHAAKLARVAPLEAGDVAHLPDDADRIPVGAALVACTATGRPLQGHPVTYWAGPRLDSGSNPCRLLLWVPA